MRMYGGVPITSVEPRVVTAEDFRELLVPIEGIDPQSFILVRKAQLLIVIEVGADEGVAALDVAAQVGQGAGADLDGVFVDDVLVRLGEPLVRGGHRRSALGRPHRLVGPDQDLGGDAEARVKTPDHLDGERALAVEHLGHSRPAPDERLKIAP